MLDPEEEQAAALAYAQSTPFDNARIFGLYAGLRYDLWKTGMPNWMEESKAVMDQACRFESHGVGYLEFWASTLRQKVERQYFASLPPLSAVAELAKRFAVKKEDL